MKNIWFHLKRLKAQFKELTQKEFKAVTHRIDQARNELADIQKQMLYYYSDVLRDQKKYLLQHLEKWSGIEENILKQNRGQNGLDLVILIHNISQLL